MELDVDWSVPFDAMRAELDRLLAGNRALGRPGGRPAGHRRRRRSSSGCGRWSAPGRGPRCSTCGAQVRERLVGWLQREHAYGLPRVRLDGGAASAPVAPVMSVAEHENAALFTGSSEARERSRAFTGAR